MALTHIKLPEGYVLSPNVFTGIAYEFNGNYQIQTDLPHGLITGDVFYIKSPVLVYNGFFRTGSFNATQIEVLTLGDSQNIPFIKGTTINLWGSFGSHGWSCVHLPIVYSISNTRWPDNSEDTIRIISSVTDSDGYCNITASGDIKATGSAVALDFVKITGSTDDDLNGVWQIITYSSDTSFVLNIPYSSANDTALTNASIQYYYNNYVTKVQVWGGLNIGHEYYAQKPYELLATLDLIPDQDNICMFSISEILKKQIEIENNLLLGTLPNNLDAWTGFFIKYSEEYDESDGTTLSRSTVSYTTDSFEGYAVNSVLPFKNVHSGSLSEYVSVSSTQKFLTNWERPTIFSGKYFDLGFINRSFYDSFENPALSEFKNQGSGTAWTTGSTPSVTLADGGSSSILSGRMPVAFKNGVTYRIAISVSNSGISNTFVVTAIDPSSNTVVNFIQSIVSGGTTIFTADLQATGNDSYFNIRLIDQAGVGGGTLTINDYWIYPLDDTNFSSVYLSEDGELTEIDISNEGVIRAQLSDPDCDNDSVSVSITKGLILPFEPASSWTDISAWTSKSLNVFNYTDASSPYTGQQSYMPVSVTSGDIYKFSITFILTGTYNGSIQVDVAITDASNITISNVETISITTAEGSDTLNANLLVTSTNANARLQIITTVSVGSGSIDLDATLPGIYTVIHGEDITETKTIDIDCKCIPTQAEEGIYLSWLNNVGGFDYWLFTAYKDHITDIVNSGETSVNTFPNWPISHGEFADTYKKKQTFIESFDQLLVRAGNLTKEQAEMIGRIKTSPLVQIVNSIYDRRTVIVDKDTFVVYPEDKKLHEISFTITYTDDVPSQRV